MAVRPEEAAYWDAQAAKLCDNIWKRQWIVRKLLGFHLIGRRVLEIGVGPGNTFGAIGVVLLGNIKYMGTDVSAKYCEWNRKTWKADVRQADIREIPAEDNWFDYVVALDSLEHVRREDRPQGYKEIDRVLKRKDGKVIINMPLSESAHNPEFDHGFQEKDFWEFLVALNLRCETFERYMLRLKDGELLKYGWAVAVRGNGVQ